MKTLDYIKGEIAAIDKQTANEELSKREAKQLEKRRKLHYDCQLYLETHPTEEFLLKQKKDCKKKIDFINGNFSTWLNNNAKEAEAVKNPKSKYHTVMGLKTIKSQLATLNYLLS